MRFGGPEVEADGIPETLNPGGTPGAYAKSHSRKSCHQLLLYRMQLFSVENVRVCMPASQLEAFRSRRGIIITWYTVLPGKPLVTVIYRSRGVFQVTSLLVEHRTSPATPAQQEETGKADIPVTRRQNSRQSKHPPFFAVPLAVPDAELT